MANTGKDLTDIIEILKKVNIFSETDDVTLEKIAKRLKPLHLKKNETVITKGERGRTMYVIVNGVVNVHDRDHVFTTLTDGQAFGEYSLIDTELRSASVTGAEPTDLLRFDQEDFYALLSVSSGFAKGILKVLIARLRQLDIVQEQLASSNARIKNQKEEIHKINKELEVINEDKDNILGLVAQDLRDPITSVISLADSLTSEINEERPDLREYSDAMMNSLWKMNDMVQRILNVRSLEVAKFVFNYEKVELEKKSERNYF